MKIVIMNCKEYEAVRIFEMINLMLKKHKETQIMVDEKLYKSLIRDSWRTNVREVECATTLQHYSPRDVKEFSHGNESVEGKIQVLQTASFTSNCRGFMQLVSFKSNEVDYNHLKAGIKRILFINAEY